MTSKLSALNKVSEEFVLSIAKELISLNNTKQAAEFLTRTLRQINIDACELKYGESKIVIGSIQGSRALRPILLLSHLDVAPIGNENEWRFPPFKALSLNGKLYGRGSCDAKGCLASAVAALKAVNSISQPKRTTFLVAIPDGENGFKSINKLIDIKPLRGSIAIVLEPTGLKISNVQRGMVHFKLKVKGKQSHVATPWLSDNPIRAMIDVISHLKKLEPAHPIYPTEIDKVPKGYPNLLSTFMLGLNTFTVANLETKFEGHTIPEVALADIFVTLLPGQKLDELVDKLRTLFRSIKREISLEVTEHIPPVVESANSEIVRILAKSIRLVTGTYPDYEWFPWPTATVPLKETGIADEVVVFGPGDFNVAHRYNEHVGINQLICAAKILTALLLQTSN